MSDVQTLVEQIRDWELDAGEGFCDYFFDAYSYDGKWLAFLEEKGFPEVAQAVREDVYVCRDGTVLGCTDQELKFEPYTAALYEAELPWNEEVYRQDVVLWAEYILRDEKLLAEFHAFLKGED